MHAHSDGQPQEYTQDTLTLPECLLCSISPFLFVSLGESLRNGDIIPFLLGGGEEELVLDKAETQYILKFIYPLSWI